MAVCTQFYAASREYPVIFLTFKDVKCLTWEETYQKIRILISLEFMRHSELETSQTLTTYEKEQYHRFASDKVTENRLPNGFAAFVIASS